MTEKRVSWFSIPGLSVLLIFLNALIPMPLLVGIQFVILMLSFKRIRLVYSLVVAFAFVFIQSYVCIMLGTDTITLFLQQFVSISVTAAYWFTFVDENNIFEYLHLYKQLAIFAAAVAIFQYVMSQLWITSLATMSWLIKDQLGTPVGRSAAFLNEPSYCALVLFPLVFFGIYQFLGRYLAAQTFRLKPWELITIFAGFFFTGSSTGFLGVAFSILVILLEYRFSYRQLLILLMAVAFLGIIYFKVSFVQQRVNDTVGLIVGKGSLSSVNLSTQALFTNKNIAMDSFVATDGLGGGMGSHSLSYNKFINQYGPNIALLNNFDANSLMLRIISELGILGILIVVLFLYYYRFRRNGNESLGMYRIISQMCLCYFFIRLFRFGHYFDCGIYMFIAMYYQCYRISKQGRLPNKNGQVENAEKD